MFFDTQVEHCMARVKFDTRIGRTMAKKEETFAPLKPSHVMTTTSGNIKVTTKLYGSVENGRLAREIVAAQRRADQLNLAKIERIERIREDDSPYGT